ncbi:MAG: hypothetical protein Q8R63_06905 [Ramlibacter sp.]|nr:hypothetical protein [Ramlibacter sp.]
MKTHPSLRPAVATQNPQPPTAKTPNAAQDDPRERLEILRQRLFAHQTLCSLLAAIPVRPGGKTAAQELSLREAAHSTAQLEMASSQTLVRLGETARPPTVHDTPFNDWSQAARDLHTARSALGSIERQVTTLEHNIERVESGLIDKSRIFEGL